MRHPINKIKVGFAIAKGIAWLINLYISRFDYIPDKLLETIISYTAKFIKDKNNRKYVDKLLQLYREKHAALYFHKRIILNLNFTVRKRLAHIMLKYSQTRMTDFDKEKPGPVWMGISPSMKCNSNCKLCYANDYSQDRELSKETLVSLLKQAQKLGVFMVSITGGEPMLYDNLLKICKKFKNMLFIMFTNGTLLNEKNVKKIARLGNIAPMLSIDGDRSINDKSRGAGSFDTVMAAMDLLKSKGVAFGFSATANGENADCILSDEFIELMVEKGAVVGWISQYIPLGRFADTSLVVTPEQRAEMFYKARELFKKYPLFLIDMWNNAWLMGGCIGAGKYFFHINNRGRVEPCNMVHFSVDSIYEKSLKEVLDSDFFRAIRKEQPFNKNLMVSCLANENNMLLKCLVEKFKAQPSHPLAQSLLCDPLLGFFNDYGCRWETLAAPMWEKIKKDKAAFEKQFNVN